MTCKNCGADVDAEALECPYCGTKNPGGISFFVMLKYKRAQNQELRKKVLDRSKEGIINRIMNRTIFALVIVFILMVGISFWTFFFTEGNHLFKPSDREQVMQELYENGEYDRLNTYMQQTVLRHLYSVLLLESKFVQTRYKNTHLFLLRSLVAL